MANEPVTLEGLREKVQPALAQSAGVRALKGLKVPLWDSPEFHKLYFSARCSCGTAAVLSAEIGRGKTMPEVEAAMPAMAERLRAQAKTFFDMPCEAHVRMQIGNAPRRRGSQSTSKGASHGQA